MEALSLAVVAGAGESSMPGIAAELTEVSGNPLAADGFSGDPVKCRFDPQMMLRVDYSDFVAAH